MRQQVAMEIPQEVMSICSILTKSSYMAYPVGGCVRDVVMGKKPKDWDIATSAPLATTLELLSNIQDCIEIKPTGESFPVCRIRFSNGNEYEIATFRKDKGRGKNTSFEYGTIEDDVARRDLTINAMFYDIEKSEIVDLVGGLTDLKEGIIRFVGDPKERIFEDPSRVQRAIRMAIRFDFEIETASKKAIIEYGNQIVSKEVWGEDRIPFERVYAEFIKAADNDIATYFETLDDYGILDQFFPNLNLTKTHFKFNDIRLIAAALLREEDPKKVRHTLIEICKWPSPKAKAVSTLIESLKFTGKNVAKMVKSFEGTYLMPDSVATFVEVFLQQHEAHMVKRACVYIEQISGDDLLKEGFTGKKLGEKKVELEDAKFAIFCQS